MINRSKINENSIPPKFKRIRSGLYELENFTIERLDRMTEHYPGEDYYNTWRVYEKTSACNEDIWIRHYATLADAKLAIYRVAYSCNKRRG